MKFHFIIFLLSFSYSIFGQDYSLKTISVRDKFNTNLITCSPFIDQDGFAWYAVDSEGLFYKYDGKNKIRFSFFDSKEKNSSWVSVVYSWIQDTNGNVWAINSAGAYIINPKTHKIKFIKWDLQIANQDYSKLRDYFYITSIKDNDHNIWISLGGSFLLKFDKNYKQSRYTNSRLTELAKKALKTGVFEKEATLKIVKKLNDGRILAHSQSDLYILDATGLHFFSSIAKLDKEIKKNFFFVENGKFFKRNSSGYYIFNNIKYKYVFIKELNLQVFNYPFDNFFHTKNKIFSAFQNKVFVSKLNNDEHTLKVMDTIKFKKDINYNYLNQNTENSTSFSTYDKIYLLRTTDMQFKKKLQLKDSQISVRGIVSDKKNNIYVGSNRGLYKINETNKSSTKLYDPSYSLNYYRYLLIDTDSILWATVEADHIRTIDLKNGTEKNVTFKGKAGFRCKFMKEISKNSFWLGTNEGLYVFNKESGTLVRHVTESDKKKYTCEDILITTNNDIWIATQEGLLYKKKVENLLNMQIKIISWRIST